MEQKKFNNLDEFTCKDGQSIYMVFVPKDTLNLDRDKTEELKNKFLNFKGKYPVEAELCRQKDFEECRKIIKGLKDKDFPVID